MNDTVVRIITIAGLAVLTLTGCATSDEDYARQLKESQRRQFGKPDPITSREIKTETRTPVQTEIRRTLEPIKPKEEPKPVEPTLTDVLKDKVLVSPYTLTSPIMGKWAWVPDSTFVMVLTQEGVLQYGPTQAGFYQMISPTAIRFQITQVNGVSVGGTSPQDWQVAFFENNTVLLLSKGAQAMPFRRVE